MSKLQYVKTVEEWNNIVTEHDEKKNLLVACFSASWCGPCKALKPKLEALSLQYGDAVVFLKVDIDEVEEIANKFEIASVPTTLIIKNCNVVKTVVGADILGIQTGIDNNLPYTS
jgi:thioredoxin 1